MQTSAERVAALLLAFGQGGAGSEHGVSDLARAVGRERSQVSRMLHALERGGLVEQVPRTRRYRLGWALLVLASGAGDAALLRTARPVLRKVVARTGEVALLSVQRGNRSLTVAREESMQSLRAGGWVGRSSPMHCTASGRALLFDSDDEVVEALTSDDLLAPTHGLAGPRDLAELLDRLRTERDRGYALASEEVEIGLTSLGVPIRDDAGDLVAVINISGPTSRLVMRVEEISRRLLAAATAIETALSHPFDSSPGERRPSGAGRRAPTN